MLEAVGNQHRGEECSTLAEGDGTAQRDWRYSAPDLVRLHASLLPLASRRGLHDSLSLRVILMTITQFQLTKIIRVAHCYNRLPLWLLKNKYITVHITFIF